MTSGSCGELRVSPSTSQPPAPFLALVPVASLPPTAPPCRKLDLRLGPGRALSWEVPVPLELGLLGSVETLSHLAEEPQHSAGLRPAPPDPGGLAADSRLLSSSRAFLFLTFVVL